jgi:glutamate--cysteine ligase
MLIEPQKNLSNEIRSMEDIYNWFSSHFKTEENQLIGIEHEKILFDCSTDIPKRADYKSIKKILEILERTGWEWSPVAEFTHHVELKKNNETVSLESGGQIEYSGRPCPTLQHVEYYFNAHLEELKTILPPNFFFSSLSFDPITPLKNFPSIPKKRYRFLEPYLGYWGTAMMRGTASLQVSFDYCSSIDLMKKLTVVSTFQPLIASLCLSSPLAEGNLSPYQSYRSYVWNQIDPIRTGGCFAKIPQPQTLESYIDQILKIPMIFLLKNQQYIHAEGESFYDFMQGRLKALPGVFPTEKDLATFIGTTYPDVRLKNTIELRGMDALPKDYALFIPAFWTGLLYDNGTLETAYRLALTIPYGDFMGWRTNVPKGKVSQDNIPLINTLLGLSHEGLKKRTTHEENFIEPFMAFIQDGKTIADSIKQDFSRLPLTDFIKTWSH